MTESAKQPNPATLSPEAAKVLQTKKLTGRQRLKPWIKLLNELAVFDEIEDQVRGRFKSRMILCIVAAVVLAIATVIVGANIRGPAWLVLLLLAAAAVAGAVVFGIKWSRLKDIDLDNEFRLLLIPFLDAIAEDVDPSGRIVLDLDLAGMTEAKKKYEKPLDPGRWKKVTEMFYEDPWCKVEAPLMGGNRLLLSIENQYTANKREWKNPRGKSKSKTKWKKLVVVSAGLAPNSETLGVDADRPVDGKVKVSEKGDARIVRVVHKFKYESVGERPEESLPPDDLVGVFFQVGSMLVQAKAGS